MRIRSYISKPKGVREQKGVGNTGEEEWCYGVSWLNP